MPVLNGFVMFSTLILIVFLLGFHNFLTNYEENGCNMTYLFEYPQFVRISLLPNVTARYKRYGLYAFGEGRAIEKVRSMKFNGIPVLFIPGSRGSPKQVRSLASVSLRKTLGSRTPFHFDYFAVDLNDDHSGVFGGVLDDQTNFVKICIEKVIHLYKMNNPPESVILVGHSMGGLVAKGLFLDPDFNAKRVKIILSLATPHAPALLPDHFMAQYYHKVNTFWDNNFSFRKHLTIISIGGGARDLIVKSSLTVTKHADLNIISPAVPDVWLSVDHYCILWCKELVVVLARALFDCVDLSTKQITSDVHLRRDIFNYHLLNRSAGKKFQSGRHLDMTLWNGSTNTDFWMPLEKDRWTWEGPVKRTMFVTVSLATAADTLLVEAVNHKTRDWVFACKNHVTVEGVKICKNGENLSALGRIVPSKLGKRKSVRLNLSKLRMDGNTYVAIKTLPSSEPVSLWFDLFKERDRLTVVNPYYLKSSVVEIEGGKGGLSSTLEFSSLHRPWHVYTISVESANCFLPDLARATLRVPWGNEGFTKVISGQGGSFPVSVYTPKPPGKSIKDVKVELILDPTCSYMLRIEKSLTMGLGALVGKIGLGVLCSVAVVLLMTLAAQVASLGEAAACPLLHSILPSAARPYYILPAFSLSSAVARYLASFAPWLPDTDVRHGNGLMDALFVPLFLHCAALALTYILGIVVLLSVIFYGQAFNNVLLRFVNKFLFGLSWMSESVLSVLRRLPAIVAAFMLLLSLTASAGLAMAVGLFFFFFKMVSLYEDFWQEIVYWPLRVLKTQLFKKKPLKEITSEGDDKEKELKDEQEETDHEEKKMDETEKEKKESIFSISRFEIPPTDDISFHLTLLMLWGLLTIIAIPSLLTWAKNYRYSTKLEPDPFLIHGLVMSFCASIFWQSNIPKTNLAGGKCVSRGIFGSAVLTMVYGRVSLYRVATLVTAVLAAVATHQTLAPYFTPKEEIPVESLKNNTSDADRQIKKAFFASASDEIFSPDDSPSHQEDKSVGSSDASSPASGGSSDNDDESEDKEEDEEEVGEMKQEEGISEQSSFAEGEKTTPSSDISTSSFENISLKDIKD